MKNKKSWTKNEEVLNTQGLRWTWKLHQCTNWKENLQMKNIGLSSWSVKLVRPAGPSNWSVQSIQLVCLAGLSSWSIQLVWLADPITHCILHVASYTFHLTHCIIHIAFYNLHITHCALHGASYTLHKSLECLFQKSLKN